MVQNTLFVYVKQKTNKKETPTTKQNNKGLRVHDDKLEEYLKCQSERVNYFLDIMNCRFCGSSSSELRNLHCYCSSLESSV